MVKGDVERLKSLVREDSCVWGLIREMLRSDRDVFPVSSFSSGSGVQIEGALNVLGREGVIAQTPQGDYCLTHEYENGKIKRDEAYRGKLLRDLTLRLRGDLL